MDLNLIVRVNIGLGGWTEIGLVWGQFGGFQTYTLYRLIATLLNKIVIKNALKRKNNNTFTDPKPLNGSVCESYSNLIHEIF